MTTEGLACNLGPRGAKYCQKISMSLRMGDNNKRGLMAMQRDIP